MLASSFYYLIDAALVGAFLGETAFAALNLVMPFIIVNFSVGDLVGVGATVPISIALGQRDEKKANNIFTCALIIIITSGALLGSIMFGFAPTLVNAMGADGELARLAVSYMRAYALFSPLTTITYAMDNFLKICGKIRYSLWVNILMAAVSTVLEILFLAVFKLDIWSAATASSIGMITCATVAFIPFLRGKEHLKLCKPTFSIDLFRRIIACGTPTFLNNIAGRVVSVLMNFLLMARGGETAISVYGILMNIQGFIHSLLYGICDALQPAVGYNWGAKKYSRVKAIEGCCFSAAGTVAVISAVVVFLFPEFLTLFFVKQADAALLEISVPAIRILSVAFIASWTCFASQSYLLAVEKAGKATILSICNVLVFPLIAIAALLPYGLSGLWLNVPVTAFSSAILAIILTLGINREMNINIQSDKQKIPHNF